MLPKTHIILGFLFSFLVWIVFPGLSIFYIVLIFLSSFLIDIDHYLSYVFEVKDLSLRRARAYYSVLGKIEKEERKKGIRKKGPFHVFHTLEFLLITYLSSFIWNPMLYVFIGMAFHSLLDIFYLVYRDVMYRREFFFLNWIRKKF